MQGIFLTLFKIVVIFLVCVCVCVHAHIRAQLFSCVWLFVTL